MPKIKAEDLTLSEKYKDEDPKKLANRANFWEERIVGIKAAIKAGRKIPKETLKKIKKNRDNFFEEVGITSSNKID